ncbi:hypothetical protein X769_25975 [Mesorhizobium sp. LSJC268A00]|nr:MULTISPECIES: hypothetical protein [unclassified Mesorhizobium]ESW98054.1 hypothetical protein X769_25975 [Mesorhizobium sp. LSJC268A00]ESZ10976.1 hypothetical protein X735_26930 [Mesorhizobium sp. L2C085B000]
MVGLQGSPTAQRCVKGPRDSATHLHREAAKPALGQIEIGRAASRQALL